MNSLDLIVRGGVIITESNSFPADIGIAEGVIQALKPDLSETAKEEVDARGLNIFPGIIDSHVHFDEPGRTHWEGLASGSRALAAGGGTMFFDMPLNSHPPTIDGPAFDQKLAAAQANSLVDFAFWGGLVPGNLDRLEELSERGVIGFKAFMANSGIEDFPWVDQKTLREGMKQAARLDKIVALHAESEEITRQRTEEHLRRGDASIADYLDSRPIAAELEAIRCALDLAGETGCAIHIVHVSSSAGVAAISEAKKRGVNVSAETCPHYLTLTDEDLMQLGTVAKCAPPLRGKPVQEELWSAVRDGKFDTIGSDHSPSPPDLKQHANFFKVWGGISSVQHALPLLLTEGYDRGRLRLGNVLNLEIIPKLTSANVARRFRLPSTKGRLQIGADADLALVALNESFEVKAEELLYRHPQTPYMGRRLTGKVVQTILRGVTVFQDGKIVADPMGRIVRPEGRSQ